MKSMTGMLESAKKSEEDLKNSNAKQQELEAQVSVLKTRIEELEKENERLKFQNDAMIEFHENLKVSLYNLEQKSKINKQIEE